MRTHKEEQQYNMMYATQLIYKMLYYMQCLYNYIDKQRIELLGQLNVVSVNLYDFENVQKKSMYHQSYLQIIRALFYKSILKNEQKFRSCLFWEDDAGLNQWIDNIQATQLLEIRFTDDRVSYVRNNKVQHVPQSKRRSLQHCALASIANKINANSITFLLNHVFPLNLTVKEFISLVYLKKMVNKDDLLRSLLRHGLLLKTIMMEDFDMKECDYKDDQVILRIT